MKRAVEIISTVFYLGYSPFAPGTVGTLPGIAAYLLLKDNIPVLTAAIIVMLVGGAFICKAAESSFGEKDSSKIVFDEFVGVMIAFYLVPINLWTVIAGFCLFRAFDILKPFPIRRIEAVRNGWGVMLDDAVSGIYANICLCLLNIFFG